MNITKEEFREKLNNMSEEEFKEALIDYLHDTTTKTDDDWKDELEIWMCSRLASGIALDWFYKIAAPDED